MIYRRLETVMNIMVDATPMNNLVTGVTRYTRNLYREIESMTDVTVSYYTRKGLLEGMPRAPDSQRWMSAISGVWRLPDSIVFFLRTLFWLKFEHGLRKQIKKSNFSVCHETGFVPPAVRDIPVIYTLCDLSLIRFPETHPRERVWFFNFFFKRRLSFADHIIAISEYVRKEILREFRLDEDQVTTIPLAADPCFYPRRPEEIASLLKSRNWPETYLLFVGSLEPRKNLPFLVKALQELKHRIPLIVAGWEGWGDKAWMEEIKKSGLEDLVIFAGYLDDESIARLYSGARVLVYPSLYEGFGLPILEAMACGCPVVCSNRSSLPEVAGDGAILVNPCHVEELAEAIDRIVGDDALRDDLIQKGFARLSLFNWQQSAKDTIKVFQKVVGGK